MTNRSMNQDLGTCRGRGVAGWHGKLPALGDFASRRLCSDFLEPWDAWISSGMVQLRLQPEWLERYLACPVWRFVLMPDALPDAGAAFAWMGILMPSVDSVGRYYPFTVAQPMVAGPSCAGELDESLASLTGLENAATDALHEDWDVDALEQALSLLGDADEAPGISRCISACASSWTDRMRGAAFWYSAPLGQASALIGSRGLAEPGLLQRLFCSPGTRQP
jgi:type VI secretion system protein ImpM